MITVELFQGKVIQDAAGAEQVIDDNIAQAIYENLIVNGYIKKGLLTEKYHEESRTVL